MRNWGLISKVYRITISLSTIVSSVNCKKLSELQNTRYGKEIGKVQDRRCMVMKEKCFLDIN